MLKQRHSTSVLSSKTLSRQKFINNKTVQQPHNISTQSGKQVRTLRNQSKNKSCYIPKHLAQSTQSHLVYSNERGSQKYKSTAKNYATENFNTNLSRNDNIGQSKMTLVTSNHMLKNKQMFSDTLNPATDGNQMVYSYQPYLSLQPNEHSSKPRLSHQNQHMPQNLMPINPSTHLPTSPGISKTTGQIVKQKLLQKQVKQMFLYKNKQLTKVLQQMHRFCISVKELKWICQEVTGIIKKYNQDMKVYYQEFYGVFSPKTDLDNIAYEAEQLLRRFNQLAYLNSSHQHGYLFNFKELINGNNLSAYNNKDTNNSIFTQHQQLHQEDHKGKSIANQGSNESPSHPSSSSPENPHSWSKLIANLQQQQLPKPFPTQNQPGLITSEQNSKNFTIRTFQVTQNNSPFKNKTLNQLIRLSELRKTQFDTQNKQNSQLYANNQYMNPQIMQNNRFTKKQVPVSYIESKEMSTQKDPFDSIHLPHFNTKPITDQQQSKQTQKSMKQSQKYFNQSQKLYYQQQIQLLKKQIYNLDKENNQYFRKLKQKNQELQKDNQRLKEKIMISSEKFNSFQRQVYTLVERALNELINCTKINVSHDHSHVPQDKKTYGKMNHGYNSLDRFEDILKTKPIPKLQPSMFIKNQSFLQLIHCLEQVFRLQQCMADQQGENIGKYTGNASAFDMNAKRNEVKTQRAPSRNRQADIVDEQLKYQLNSLIQQITQLQRVKLTLQKEITKLQTKFNSLNRETDKDKSSHEYDLSQMIFAQAFTIQEILQLNDSNIQQIN